MKRTVVLALLATVLSAVAATLPARRAVPLSGRDDPPGGWRAELVDDLLVPWSRHARDSLHGGFRTHLDRRWRPTGPAEKYPSMLGRHLFGYSAGYLLTGDGRWLDLADDAYRYLVRHGWDRERGGWYDRLSRAGEPVDSTKSTFVQVYAATGLALYHFVTRRPDVLRRIRETNRLLEERFRDAGRGGYHRRLSRGFAVLDGSKTAASQLAPVSGHLLYLYAGTRDTAHLRQAERLTRIAARRMRDPGTGWIRERFDATWEPAPGSEPETFNVGHNLEVAWILARLHLATGREAYREEALALGRRVAGGGFIEGEGAWVRKVTRPAARRGAPAPDSGRVLWWIEAYGNMTELTLHRVTEETAEPHLDRYRRGVAFWRRHLLDRRRGGALTAVAPDGAVLNGGKGGRWKSPYHAVEHALWNHLGEALWLTEDGRVTLHFRPAPGEEREDPGKPGGDPGEFERRICPRPVPDPAVVIRSVRAGGRDVPVPSEAACFRVPADGEPVTVELGVGGRATALPGR